MDFPILPCFWWSMDTIHIASHVVAHLRLHGAIFKYLSDPETHRVVDEAIQYDPTEVQ